MEQEVVQVSGRLLTPAEVGKRLGVVAKTVRRWLGSGQLPVQFIKLPGGGLRVPESELDQYISQGKRLGR